MAIKPKQEQQQNGNCHTHTLPMGLGHAFTRCNAIIEKSIKIRRTLVKNYIFDVLIFFSQEPRISFSRTSCRSVWLISLRWMIFSCFFLSKRINVFHFFCAGTFVRLSGIAINKFKLRISQNFGAQRENKINDWKSCNGRKSACECKFRIFRNERERGRSK